jgi:hypothetical protein
MGASNSLGAVAKRILREPLVQFLALGFVLFLVFSGFVRDAGEGPGHSGEGQDPAEIRVERAALLAYVQMRTQEPSALANSRAFDALEIEARNIWVARFVREEALVREAKALGLDRDDDLIRRRLVQKVEFLTRGLVEKEIDVSPGALDTFLHGREEEYRRPVLLAFTHVFVGSGKAPSAAARGRVELLGSQLNRAKLGSQAALSLGDRFLYNRSYADRTFDEVRSHFGSGFAEALLTLPVDPNQWLGPIESDHGWHVVLLTRRQESSLPTRAEIASTLRRDLVNERRDETLERSLEALVSKYRVEVDPELFVSRP